MPDQVGHRDSASLRKGLNERVQAPWRGPTVAVRTEGGFPGPGGAWLVAARAAAPMAAHAAAAATASLPREPRRVGDMETSPEDWEANDTPALEPHSTRVLRAGERPDLGLLRVTRRRSAFHGRRQHEQEHLPRH